MWKELETFFKPGTEEYNFLKKVDFSRLPVHIAVIMDGNGRWARQRGLPRIEGHIAGSKSVQEIVEASARLGIKYLTLYAFSKENWKRPWHEVRKLWSLLRDYLRSEDKVLIENSLRLLVIGGREGIPSTVRHELERVENLTRKNDRMTICLALNYSGRDEIVNAVRKILAGGSITSSEIDEQVFSNFLSTAGLPDPDLLIRTSGEMRVSNFLLWQIAYTEIWVTSVLWPDFNRLHLLQAIIDYQKRERRFGAVSPSERDSRPSRGKSRIKNIQGEKKL